MAALGFTTSASPSLDSSVEERLQQDRREAEEKAKEKASVQERVRRERLENEKVEPHLAYRPLHIGCPLRCRGPFPGSNASYSTHTEREGTCPRARPVATPLFLRSWRLLFAAPTPPRNCVLCKAREDRERAQIRVNQSHRSSHAAYSEILRTKNHSYIVLAE